MNSYREIPSTITNFNDAHFSEDYETYLVKTSADLNLPLPIDYAFGIEIAPTYYIFTIKHGMVDSFKKDVPVISNIDTSFPYTLNNTDPFEAAKITSFSNPNYLYLQGKGTIVAIIDTGIDYLNPQFWDENGNSRIISIWDQTINTQTGTHIAPFGTVYTNEQINLAINAYKNGKDPYEIVPSKDVIGHGTQLAGLVGAKGLNGVYGGASQCSFVIVKLIQMKERDLLLTGIHERTTEIYGGIDLLLAIHFCYELKDTLLKPMAVLLGLGTNFGGHDGISSIERFIDLWGQKIGFVFVTGTGNEGESETHASTLIDKNFQFKNFYVNIDENENNFSLSIWINKPNIISAGFISPSGEVIAPVPAKIVKSEEYNLIFEESVVAFNYSLNEYTTGDEYIFITIYNPEPGVWQLRLLGDFITSGNINIWLPQRALLKPQTRFLDPDPDITLQIPSTAQLIISTVFYNQNNNSIVASSGKGFTRTGYISPLIATGGVSVITTGLNNTTVTVSGSSVASAVLCSAVLLLLEWGIVLGNDPTMYGKNIQSYLARGAITRPGDVYPNRQWGWGMLNLENTFLNLRSFNFNNRGTSFEYISTSLEIKIPEDLYARLIKVMNIKGD